MRPSGGWDDQPQRRPPRCCVKRRLWILILRSRAPSSPFFSWARGLPRRRRPCGRDGSALRGRTGGGDRARCVRDPGYAGAPWQSWAMRNAAPSCWSGPLRMIPAMHRHASRLALRNAFSRRWILRDWRSSSTGCASAPTIIGWVSGDVLYPGFGETSADQRSARGGPDSLAAAIRSFMSLASCCRS